MNKRLRISAPILWIVATVVLLMGLLAYFTYANYRRQQDLMGELLTREGVSLIQALEDAQREDMRRAIGTGVVILLIGGAGFYFLSVLQRSQAMQEALSETRSYAKHVVDSISNGVFSVDREGWVVSMNRAAGEILGIAPDEAVGRFYRELIAEGPCRLEPVIQQGEKFLEKEMACRSVQGHALEVVVSASQLRNDEGVVLGAVVVIRDLREIRRLQEQLRRSERLASVGQMVAGLAHEFRNPLSTIKGFARYFQRKYKEASEDGEYANLMIQEVDRLNRVITDMLGFAQPLQPQIQAVDFQTVLDRALTLCDGAISEKRIQLHTKIKENGSPTADVDLMIQVMVNLIQNAVQAVEKEGRVDIEVEREGLETVIAISDDGEGITAEDRERLFDPFFTTKSGGTGLGLSIVHSIVERHGGRIEVDSEPGQGTQFRVIIPQVEV